MHPQPTPPPFFHRMLWRALGHASLAVLRLGPAYRFEPITVPIRPIRFSESSFHRPEAAEKKFVSYIPFLIWVDLVSRLHAIRFTRLHETKLCLRLRACKQVCKVIVGLSNCNWLILSNCNWLILSNCNWLSNW